MKLGDGVTVYIGGRKYRGEIPDDLVPTVKTQPMAGAGKKSAASKPVTDEPA